MSFAAVFLGISESTQNNYFKENLIDIQYFIKEHLWISASDEATPKKLFGRSKSSLKLTLKTKWYHSCGCCDNSLICKQLKKRITDILKKKIDFET